MRIVIAGATGFIGRDLVPFLRKTGHEVKKLVRRKKDLQSDEIYWDPENEKIDETQLSGSDAIINLAGENISGRWTEKKKQLILESRVKATRTLGQSLARMQKLPQVFINASAVGYYGNMGDKLLTEQSSNGPGFLAHVCQEWEEAAKPISTNNVRLVCTRFGVVLSPKGGALAQMLTPFKLCLGGVIGSGQQYMSWIPLEELLGVIYHILKTDHLSGPVNVVSPNPVTNETFTKTLGKVLSRPTIFPLPAPIARFVLGEMADEMLLSSQRASCNKLENSGYQFCQPNLEQALIQML